MPEPSPLGAALIHAVDARLIDRAELSQAAALASLARRGATLTASQARVAHRILERHGPALSAAGITLPEAPAAPPAPLAKTNGAVPSARINADGKIAISAPFALKDLVKTIPGVKPFKHAGGFDWVLPATPTNAAAALEKLAVHGLLMSPSVAELASSYANADAARFILDESAPLPDYDYSDLIKPGWSIWDHQRRGAEFAVQMAASQLAIPMGGGKTMAAIMVVNRLARDVGPQRVAIVCPDKVRGVWPREVRKFSALGWHIVDGRKPSKRARSGSVSLSVTERLHEAEQCLFDCQCGAPVHAFSINYEALSRDPWNDWRPPGKISVVIADEVHRVKSHRLKTPKGRRTVSGVLARWVDFSVKRIGLTGTPVPQTPLDVYGIFRALDPGVFGGSFTAFKARYAVMNPHVEEMVVGYRHVEEMAEKFHSITYRPTIDLKLPKVTDITRECDLEPAAQKAYDTLDNEFWADLTGFGAGTPNLDTLRELDAALDEEVSFSEFDIEDPIFGGRIRSPHPENDPSTVTPANIMVRLLRLQQFTGGTVIDDEGIRVRVSKAKAELLADVLEEVGCSKATETHEPEPVIVFCRFRSDLDAVKEVAAAAGVRYAEISGRRHDGLTRDSEMTPDADVVAVQIQSGGTGVDFTRARVMIWYSMGYSLSDYDQARKRLDRPGQKRPVLSIHLLARGTADFDVYGALDNRRSVIDSMMAAHGVPIVATPPVLGEQEPRETEYVSGQGAVPLPFEQLIKAEATRLGAPEYRWKKEGAQ